MKHLMPLLLIVPLFIVTLYVDNANISKAEASTVSSTSNYPQDKPLNIKKVKYVGTDIVNCPEFKEINSNNLLKRSLSFVMQDEVYVLYRNICNHKTVKFELTYNGIEFTSYGGKLAISVERPLYNATYSDSNGDVLDSNLSCKDLMVKQSGKYWEKLYINCKRNSYVKIVNSWLSESLLYKPAYSNLVFSDGTIPTLTQVREVYGEKGVRFMDSYSDKKYVLEAISAQK